MYDLKKEVTHKVTQKMAHPQSISKMLHILGILTDHIATSIGCNKESSDWCLDDSKEHKEKRDFFC